MKKLFCLCLTVLISMIAFVNDGKAQGGVLDGAYAPETNGVKRLIEYPNLREADVMYKRRVWQEIDLRQKFNHPFYFPLDPIRDRKNLFDVIRCGLFPEECEIYTPSIIAYSAGPLNEDDEFRVPLSSDSVRNILTTTTIVDEYDEDGEVIGSTTRTLPLSSDQITRYRIKEDWIWDKQRSERYIRIIGIAPMIDEKDADGNSVGFKPLFWLYYPEARHLFATFDVYNMFNDAQRRTYHDLFMKRYFSSYIVKEDNAFNRRIGSYAKGLEALAESERIQQELFNLEHDMWHY